jgi:hypothetical protein
MDFPPERVAEVKVAGASLREGDAEMKCKLKQIHRGGRCWAERYPTERVGELSRM